MSEVSFDRRTVQGGRPPQHHRSTTQGTAKTETLSAALRATDDSAIFHVRGIRTTQGNLKQLSEISFSHREHRVLRGSDYAHHCIIDTARSRPLRLETAASHKTRRDRCSACSRQKSPNRTHKTGSDACLVSHSVTSVHSVANHCTKAPHGAASPDPADTAVGRWDRRSSSLTHQFPGCDTASPSRPGS